MLSVDLANIITSSSWILLKCVIFRVVEELNFLDAQTGILSYILQFSMDGLSLPDGFKRISTQLKWTGDLENWKCSSSWKFSTDYMEDLM